MSVFYDEQERFRLLGHNKEFLDRVYSSESDYFVPIISAEYEATDWPRHEFSIAKREQKKRGQTYIIPARVDDTPILGLHDDVFYFDLKRHSTKVLAADLIRRIEEEDPAVCQSSQSPKANRRKSAVTPPFIPSSEHFSALALLAVSSFPLTVESLSRLFPGMKWSQKIRNFRRYELLDSSQGMFKVKKSVFRRLFPHEKEATSFRQQWIAALRDLEHYPDLALMLALQYWRLGQRNEAVAVVAKGAVAFASRPWSAIFRNALKKMEGITRKNELDVQTRTSVLHAETCYLLSDGDNLQALARAGELLRVAQRGRSQWGIRQGYMNLGIARLHLGDTAMAIGCFRKAIRNAKRAEDKILVGRALNNLGYAVLDRSPESAARLFRQSWAIKKAVKDDEGVFGALLGLGNVHAARGEYSQARKWYYRALKQARRIDLPNGLSVALANLGRVHCDLEKPGESLSFFDEAIAVARKGNIRSCLVTALVGKAYGLGLLGRNLEAAGILRDAFREQIAAGNVEAALWSVRDRVVYLFRGGQKVASKAALRTALGLARHHGIDRMLKELHFAQADLYLESAQPGLAKRYLVSAARRENRTGSLLIALEVWAKAVGVMNMTGAPSLLVRYVIEEWTRDIPKTKRYWPQMATALSELYLLNRRDRNVSGALRVLTKLQRLATVNHNVELETQALDERGLCLQALGGFKGAETCHRAALRLARRASLRERVEISLNNLGEVLRKTGRPKTAIPVFAEAEGLARTRKDVGAEISTSQNRALALIDIGQLHDAKTLLTMCRKKAQKHDLLYEYVRSLQNLANLSWVENRKSAAKRLYAQVLLLSEKHELVDLQCHASLNLAALHQSSWQFSEALVLLRNVERHLRLIDEEFLYLRTMAECFTQLHDYVSARKYWRLSAEAARKEGFTEPAQECAALGKELDSVDSLQRYGVSQLNAMAKKERDPKARKRLLLALFELLLSLGNETQAERVFKDLQSTCSTFGADSFVAEAYAMLGDYQWHQRSSGWLPGAKAFVAGMAKALEVGPDCYAEVSGDFGRLLLSLESATPVKRLERLERELAAWIAEQTGSGKRGQIVSLLVFPVRFARTLLLRKREGTELSRRDVDGLIKAECARAMSGG